MANPLLEKLFGIKPLKRAQVDIHRELDAHIRALNPTWMVEPKGGFVEANEKVFTVYRARNGFYATVGEKMVIGSTLSEVCVAAQAEAAEQAITGEDEPKLKQKGGIEGWMSQRP